MVKDRYERLSEVEIDGLLTIAYSIYTNSKNLNTEYFIESVMKKIVHHKLEQEFSETLLRLVDSNDKETHEIVFIIVNTPIKIIKLAALKTYDDYREFLK
jgi:3-methyladenine DNA glycosylase AlkD